MMRLAVTNFPDLQGVTADLGRYVAERLTTRLSTHSQRIRVVERRRLGQVLGELRFGMSDLVDPTKAKQLGRLLGVEAIVVGTVSDLGNVVEIDARIIEIETSNILPGVTASITKDETVRQMIERGRVMPPSSATSAPSSGVSPLLASSPTTGHTLKYQEFPQLRVEVVALQVLGDGGLNLVLNYVNKTPRDFLVTLPDGWKSEAARMTDDQGNEYQSTEYTGIQVRGAGPPGGLTLPASGHATASYRFRRPDKMAQQGTRFSFNSTRLLKVPTAAGAPRVDARYSISILNIEPR